jgi:hypothetical protein
VWRVLRTKVLVVVAHVNDKIIWLALAGRMPQSSAQSFLRFLTIRTSPADAPRYDDLFGVRPRA